MMARRPTLAALLALALAWHAAPAAATECESEYDIAADLDVEGADVVLRDERRSAELARIVDGSRLTIDGEEQPLDDAQRAEVERYHELSVALVTEAKAIGRAGARFGMRAAMRAVSALFTGDGDRAESEIEAEAEELSELALRICDTVRDLHEQHEALARAVPAFGDAVPLQ